MHNNTYVRTSAITSHLLTETIFTPEVFCLSLHYQKLCKLTKLCARIFSNWPATYICTCVNNSLKYCYVNIKQRVALTYCKARLASGNEIIIMYVCTLNSYYLTNTECSANNYVHNKNFTENMYVLDKQACVAEHMTILNKILYQ